MLRDEQLPQDLCSLLERGLERLADHYGEVNELTAVDHENGIHEVRIRLDDGNDTRPFMQTVMPYLFRPEYCEGLVGYAGSARRDVTETEAAALAVQWGISPETDPDEYPLTERGVEDLYFHIKDSAIRPLLARIDQDIADPASAKTRLEEQARGQKLLSLEDDISSKLTSALPKPQDRLKVLRTLEKRFSGRNQAPT